MADTYIFYKWLQEEMNARDWTQSDLARASGLTRSTINGVVTGTRGPGIEFCNAIAHAFSLPPEEVLRQAGLIPKKPDTDPILDELNYKLASLPIEIGRAHV